MSDVVACPNCTTLFTVSAALRGQTVHCKQCGNPLTLPSETGTTQSSRRLLDLWDKEPAPIAPQTFAGRDPLANLDIRSVAGELEPSVVPGPEPQSAVQLPVRVTLPARRTGAIRPLIRATRHLPLDAFDTNHFAPDTLTRRAGHVVALLGPAAWLLPLVGIHWRIIPWAEYGSTGMVIGSMALCWIGICLVLYANMGMQPDDGPEYVYRWSTPERLLWVLGGTTCGVAILTMLFTMVATRFEGPNIAFASAQRVRLLPMPLTAPVAPAEMDLATPPTTMAVIEAAPTSRPAPDDSQKDAAAAGYQRFIEKGFVPTQIVRIIVTGGDPETIASALQTWAEQNIEGSSKSIFVTDYGRDRKVLIAASVLDIPEQASISFGTLKNVDETERIIHVDGKP